MIDKLALRYDPPEDRLLLTVGLRSTDGESKTVQVWLTRRLCRSWAADMRAMKALAASEPQSAYRTQAPVVRESSRSATKGQSTTEPATTEAAPPADMAAGAQPDLATKITCSRRRADGRWVMRFESGDRRICSLNLSDQGLNDIEAALRRQVRRAQWALAETEDSPPRAAKPDGRALH